ncbi:MAG: DUF3634 family protein [Myxococcales bacterium]|nr:DUF3634 family protein [Myxococcales bacterium]
MSARAAITICVLDVRRGVTRRVRGDLSPAVLADVRDVLANPPVERARLRLVLHAGTVQLELRGEVPEVQRQRLRNVIGTVPLAKLARGRARR